MALALRRASKTHEFVCYCCGAEFEKYTPSVELLPTFCSPECRLKGTRAFWRKADARRDKIMAHRKREREAMEVGTLQMDHREGGAVARERRKAGA